MTNAHVEDTFPISPSPLFRAPLGLDARAEPPRSVGGSRVESLPRLPFAFHFRDAAAVAAPHVDHAWLKEALEAWEAAGGRGTEVAVNITSAAREGIWARPTMRRMRSQEDVGVLLWPAAQVMARWLLAARRQLLQGRSVLEVGAGLGLSGLAAACAARTCVWTDFHDGVLVNLVRNVSLNTGTGVATEDAAALSSPARVGVCKLDWDTIETDAEDSEGESSADWEARVPGALRDDFTARGPPRAVPCLPRDYQVDVVLGSDMVCRDSDCHGVVRVLHRHLRRAPSSLGVFFLAPPDVRWGVGVFKSVVEEAGFEVVQFTVPDWAVGEKGAELEWAVASGYEERIQVYLVRWPHS
jgi:predicted nicotinamide N-methyase